MSSYEIYHNERTIKSIPGENCKSKNTIKLLKSKEV